MARIDLNDCAFAFRKTTLEDQHLPIIDNTRLTAVNTCPRWAGIRYGHNKILGAGSSRALALEVGTACHHSFAAIRLLQLYMQGCGDHAAYHAKRLFPKLDAHMELNSMMREPREVTEMLREVALFGLEYSEYYDDPSDKKRTLVNMEEAIVKYANRYNVLERKIWVQDEQNPEKLVGIEIPFDYIVQVDSIRGNFARKRVRFVGRIDGISVDVATGKVILEENKTTSQINSAWLSNWAMAHQVTGYMVVASAMTMTNVREAEVIGLAIPQPKSSPYDGLVREYVTRNTSQVNQWLAWFLHSVEEFELARTAPLDAATYTHSCTRYFRECSLMPLCTAEREDQENIFTNEMAVDEWNPLAEEGDA